MQVNIKRIDPSLPLPEYHTAGSVAFDIYTREDAIVEPHSFALVPGNFIIETPPGHMLIIAARSSSAKKKGLSMRNGIGIIDQDYCGNGDEIHIMLQNLTSEPVSISRGERLAQGVFVKIEKAEWREVNEMAKNNRGGFGSTGL